MRTENNYVIQMKDINKIYGSIKALDNMSIDIKKGTVHAILGENGAGKTTLMNILYGLYPPDSGKIFINGQETNIKNSNCAIQKGIGMVHQHFMLIENFTVTENIILGMETTNKLGILNMSKAREKVKRISQEYGLNIDLNKKIRNMPVGMQQKVEILKALYRNIDILILDEPTAVLTPLEIESLKRIIKKLSNKGKTVIIITHKLNEIKEMADECTIMRKGKFICKHKVDEISKEELAESMMGRHVKLSIDKIKHEYGKVIFEIESLTVLDRHKKEVIRDLSLKIRAGEILGIAGVTGNGQEELIKAITGQINSKSGLIKINGKEIQNKNPREIIDNKISVIYEDRHKDGIVLDFNVLENAIMKSYKNKPLSDCGIVNEKEVSKFTDKLINDYQIQPKDCKKERIRSLSGGNQQKLVIARELSSNPDLLIAVQPTRGLDIGAIEYVHKMLMNLRDKGKAVLLFSLELDEIINISDRISVLYNGEIVGTFETDDPICNEKSIGAMMAGIKIKEGRYD